VRHAIACPGSSTNGPLRNRHRSADQWPSKSYRLVTFRMMGLRVVAAPSRFMVPGEARSQMRRPHVSFRCPARRSPWRFRAVATGYRFVRTVDSSPRSVVNGPPSSTGFRSRFMVNSIFCDAVAPAFRLGLVPLLREALEVFRGQLMAPCALSEFLAMNGLGHGAIEAPSRTCHGKHPKAWVKGRRGATADRGRDKPGRRLHEITIGCAELRI